MQAVKDAIFGKQLTPQELSRKWKRELNQQIRNIENDIRKLELGTNKTKQEIKVALKRKDLDSAKTLAREIANVNKNIKKLHNSKSQIKSIILELDHMAALVKVTGCFQKSTEIMQYIGNLIRQPEIAIIMRTMAQEMDKAGVIEQLIEDTLDGNNADDEEEAAEGEVQKIIDEMTLSQVAKLPSVSVDNHRVRAPVAVRISQPVGLDPVFEMQAGGN